MNKLIPTTLLLAFAGSAFAQMPTPEEIMKESDANKDGIITKKEASVTPLKDFFDMFDANQDGKITMAELKAVAGGR